MRGYTKSLIVSILILSIMSINAFAMDILPSNVKLEGNAEGIVFIPGDELFLYKYNMVPGDSVYREMTIKNEYDSSYKLYMRAERVSEKEEFDLLEKLELKVTYGDKVIYEGAASGKDGLEENIYLGTYYPGDEVKLIGEVNLDGETTGNEYRNKYAEVDWIFTAVRDVEVEPENPNKPGNLPQTGGNNSYLYLGMGLLILLTGSVLFIKKKENVL